MLELSNIGILGIKHQISRVFAHNHANKKHNKINGLEKQRRNSQTCAQKVIPFIPHLRIKLAKYVKKLVMNHLF
jgi:hypothetical protein